MSHLSGVASLIGNTNQVVGYPGSTGNIQLFFDQSFNFNAQNALNPANYHRIATSMFTSTFESGYITQQNFIPMNTSGAYGGDFFTLNVPANYVMHVEAIGLAISQDGTSGCVGFHTEWYVWNNGITAGPLATSFPTVTLYSSDAPSNALNGSTATWSVSGNDVILSFARPPTGPQPASFALCTYKWFCCPNSITSINENKNTVKNVFNEINALKFKLFNSEISDDDRIKLISLIKEKEMVLKTRSSEVDTIQQSINDLEKSLFRDNLSDKEKIDLIKFINGRKSELLDKRGIF
jgi:hypothetical protein